MIDIDIAPPCVMCTIQSLMCDWLPSVQWVWIGDVLTGSFSFENRNPTDTELDLMQQMEVENTR